MKSSEASKPDDQADGTTEEARVGKRTVLRAEAPEFVPMRRFEQQMRGLSVDSRPAAPRPSVQNRLNRAKTSHQNTQVYATTISWLKFTFKNSVFNKLTQTSNHNQTKKKNRTKYLFRRGFYQ